MRLYVELMVLIWLDRLGFRRLLRRIASTSVPPTRSRKPTWRVGGFSRVVARVSFVAVYFAVSECVGPLTQPSSTSTRRYAPSSAEGHSEEE